MGPEIVPVIDYVIIYPVVEVVSWYRQIFPHLQHISTCAVGRRPVSMLNVRIFDIFLSSAPCFVLLHLSKLILSFLHQLLHHSHHSCCDTTFSLHHLFKPSTMKLSSLFIIASSFLTVSAFGVSPSTRTSVVKPATTVLKTPPTTAFTKASASPLFRDVQKIRGGAVPGWAAYNEALDKKPLITKALTSLVGWALGDLLAQVCL